MEFSIGNYYKYKGGISNSTLIENEVYKNYEFQDLKNGKIAMLEDVQGRHFWVYTTDNLYFTKSGITDETWNRRVAIASSSKVNSPSHYTWLRDICGIDVIDITRNMDFCLGNAVKYLLRAGHKSEQGYTDTEKTIEDLKKASWYINDKIKNLESGINDY